MTNRRSALTLAAVLAATVLTGGAAMLGITRTPPPPNLAAAQPAIVQTVAPNVSYEEGGD